MSDFTELKIIEIILVLNIKLWYIITEPKLKLEHKMKNELTKEYISNRIMYLERSLNRYENNFRFAMDGETEKVYYELTLERVNEIKLLKSL